MNLNEHIKIWDKTNQYLFELEDKEDRKDEFISPLHSAVKSRLGLFGV